MALERCGKARPGDGGERQRRAGRCIRVPAARERDSVDLSDAQLAYVKVEPVEERDFPVEEGGASAASDFDEDMAGAGVYALPGAHHRLSTPCSRRWREEGQTLFTIDSPRSAAG
mgnify:CR=1 FL=1